MEALERSITVTLRSRIGTTAIFSAAFLAMLLASETAHIPAIATGRGLVEGVGTAEMVTGSLSLLLSLLLTGAIMGAMVLINSTYNMLRTSSQLYLAVFAVMQAASPLISIRLCSGSLVALVILSAIGLMYSVYQQPRTGTRRIFLVFLLLSAGAMAQYAFLAYIPVFIAGCAQMRAFKFRSLLAAIVGLVTPWWIALGLGLIHFSQITLPTGLSIYSDLGSADTLQLAAVIIATVLSGIIITFMNMVKTYAYNAKARSFAGLLVTVTLATVILTVIDFANVTAYLTLLNCCVAYQTTLFFRINAENRGYIAVLSLFAVYIILYIWSIII